MCPLAKEAYAPPADDTEDVYGNGRAWMWWLWSCGCVLPTLPRVVAARLLRHPLAKEAALAATYTPTPLAHGGGSIDPVLSMRSGRPGVKMSVARTRHPAGRALCSSDPPCTHVPMVAAGKPRSIVRVICNPAPVIAHSALGTAACSGASSGMRTQIPTVAVGIHRSTGKVTCIPAPATALLAPGSAACSGASSGILVQL